MIGTAKTNRMKLNSGNFATLWIMTDEQRTSIRDIKRPTPWILGGRFPAAADRTQEEISVRKAMDWLGNWDPYPPFLLKVSFNGPHTPVEPPPPFDSMIEEERIHYPERPWSPADLEPLQKKIMTGDAP